MSLIRSATQLRADALAIWQAGVDAVRSDVLVENSIRVSNDLIEIGDVTWQASPGTRVWVVGAGKAGAGMVRGLERAFGRQGLQTHQVSGWVNVPADCVGSTQSVKLHAARPPGNNHPTAEGVAGTQTILDLCRRADPKDLVICVLSGGGSALLPAPMDGISLNDKQVVTQFLSSHGANIEELNSVRRVLSKVKGGGLARACRAQTLVTLIISDVLGDPLEVIASGPTIESVIDVAAARRVLDRFDPTRHSIPASIDKLLDDLARNEPADPSTQANAYPPVNVPLVIGNNAVAVDAAGMEAERRGYSHAMTSSTKLEGRVEEVARHHARMAVRMQQQRGPDCLITGGEPVVALPVDALPVDELQDRERIGKGGRNQQLPLVAWQEIAQLRTDAPNPLAGICLLSGGTDGEDGPTDAAGGFIDAEVFEASLELSAKLSDHVRRYDAYPFLDEVGGLIRTGPTHTNVCDLRVIVVDRIEPQGSRRSTNP